ncbi:MAG: sulfite exporter TauE/SafE family protein [Jannaschia sp.]
MIDTVAAGLGVTLPQFAGLLAVACLAGVVRGFSGFGTALIYVPLASTVLPPIWVLVTMTVMDIIGPLPNVPRALRDGRGKQVLGLAICAALALLPGLWTLDRMGNGMFRWVVAVLCLLTVALLASGWRWHGRMSPAIIAGSGAASGFLGGVSGLSGPPVILTYMSTTLPPAVIRANILLYLVLWDGILLAVLWAQGRLTVAPLILGAALILPYLCANVVGARLFRPEREKMYRTAAYVIIAGAALMALPIWSMP